MSKKFLIGHLARFGDCLYATTLAKQIKHDYPDSHITWAVATKYKSVLKLNPHIDRIWEIPIQDEDYYREGWNVFEREALKRQSLGEFDEIIFSQIPPLNWQNFNGTIRGTILSAYKRPITVAIDPVIELSEDEIENVRIFVEKHELNKFENVVLFECAPGSEQSPVNVNFALDVSKAVIKDNRKVCFILSSPEKLDFLHPQIIDGSELTFRENAELTHNCTLLIGCSSGITWIATSSWAKRLPMIQLLDSSYRYFYGVKYDHLRWNLNTENIIELTSFNKSIVVSAIKTFLEGGIPEIKHLEKGEYKPSYQNYAAMLKFHSNEFSAKTKLKILRNMSKNNQHLNTIGLLFYFLLSFSYEPLKIFRIYLAKVRQKFL